MNVVTKCRRVCSTVADDVYARLVLVGERETHRVVLALRQEFALQQPWRPQLAGRKSHEGLGRLPAMVVRKILGVTVVSTRVAMGP